MVPLHTPLLSEATLIKSEAMKEVRVAIVGAGFGGLGAAIRLREAGIDDVVVLERREDVGGTWWDNTYPGCACDVPAHLLLVLVCTEPRVVADVRAQAGDPRLPAARRA